MPKRNYLVEKMSKTALAKMVHKYNQSQYIGIAKLLVVKRLMSYMPLLGLSAPFLLHALFRSAYCS